MTRTRTLATVLESITDNRLTDVHTALPGKIESYNNEQQTADIKPLIKRPVIDLDGNEEVEELPVVPNVPICWPRGGGFFVSFPLAKGDPVLLVFSMYSIDQWQEKGEDVDPGDTRLHGLSGAFAIPGGASKPQKLADANSDSIVLGKDGGTQVWVKDGEIALGEENPGDKATLDSKLQIELTRIKGDLQSLQTWASAHGHTGVTTGPGTSGPPSAPSPSPSDPGSTNSDTVTLK